ncbi:TonB family protein [Cupriavidus basilensis]|uniref:TonB family protein n=1 Tax=Cupriavidus basilensis TaxID=68895 RepID=A0ABT6B1W6_9BURK|nr:TonB family protein [Cupriavidus basilensis]MDF3838482.1 TonB family protein [Cupriavidus basilensis]
MYVLTHLLSALIRSGISLLRRSQHGNMIDNPAPLSVLALAGCLIFLGFLTAMGSVRAQLPGSVDGSAAGTFPPDSVGQGLRAADSTTFASSGGRPVAPEAGTNGHLRDFDIPAQPLAAALNRYAAVANRPALFASDMVVGRVSSDVRGRYTAEAALRILLEGTGLVAEKLDTELGQTFLLKESGTKPAVPRVGMADLFSADGYAGEVQARIVQALCADPRAVPGRYSAVLRFRVDAAGRIHSARLLGSTGDAGRDAAILRTLQRVQIEMPPPEAVMEQALTMMVLPAAPHARSNGTPPCIQDNGKGAP